MVFRTEELVQREIEIGEYLVEELSMNHISEKTGLSKKTVSAHLQNMMKKLNAKDKGELLILLKTKNLYESNIAP